MSQPEPALIPAYYLARLSDYPDLSSRVSLHQTTAVQCPLTPSRPQRYVVTILALVAFRPSTRPAGRQLQCRALQSTALQLCSPLWSLPMLLTLPSTAAHSLAVPCFFIYHVSYRLLIMSCSWSTLISLHPELQSVGSRQYPLRKRSPVLPRSSSHTSNPFQHPLTPVDLVARF